MTFESKTIEKAVLQLACPSCGAPMYAGGKALMCRGERRHCFDISSEGYVNLLPPGKKNNAKTGDDAAMLAARRDFLSTGCYDKISLSAATAAAEVTGSEVSFADAGSGEGYHTLRIAEALCQMGKSVSGVGIEASKNGAKYAARRAGKAASPVLFAAGNIFKMPLLTDSCNVLFSIFAPIPGEEAERVLTDDGVIVVVSSGKKHLWELREALYGTPRENDATVAVPEGFEVKSAGECEYKITLDSQTMINNLFTMTPFFYRSPKEGRERLARLESLTVTVQSEYTVLAKIAERKG